MKLALTQSEVQERVRGQHPNQEIGLDANTVLINFIKFQNLYEAKLDGEKERHFHFRNFSEQGYFNGLGQLRTHALHLG